MMLSLRLLLAMTVTVSTTLAVRIVDFQVTQPPPLPQDAQQCTTQLFEHTFGNSFGVPALAEVVYVISKIMLESCFVTLESVPQLTVDLWEVGLE
jgi:hypothetical protein